MGFYLKVSIFWPWILHGKGFCFNTTSQSRDSTYIENKETFIWPLEMCRRSEGDSNSGPCVTLWGFWCRGWDCSVVLSQPSPQTPSRGWHQGMSMFYPWWTSISPVTAPSPAHNPFQKEPGPGQGEALRTTVPPTLTSSHTALQFCHSAVMIKNHFSFSQSLTLVMNRTGLCRVCWWRISSSISEQEWNLIPRTPQLFSQPISTNLYKPLK